MKHCQQCGTPFEVRGRNHKFCDRCSEDRYNSQTELWRKNNLVFSQAMTHNSYVRRKWPDSITPETPTNLELLQWVEAEFPKKCVYCGSPAEHIDHIIPLSKGGLHILVNLQPTCGRCNKAKGNDSDEDFRKWLELFTTRFV